MEQWEYSSSIDTLVENSSWTSKYLSINGSSLEWTSNVSNATNFFIADASDIIDLEIQDGSDFNPNNVSASNLKDQHTYNNITSFVLVELDRIQFD